MSYYDTIEVKWLGELLYARPIKWDVDISGYDFNPENDCANAVEYEITCPKCGSMCTFLISNTDITCDNCKSSVVNPHKTQTDVGHQEKEPQTNALQKKPENTKPENTKPEKKNKAKKRQKKVTRTDKNVDCSMGAIDEFLSDLEKTIIENEIDG